MPGFLSEDENRELFLSEAYGRLDVSSFWDKFGDDGDEDTQGGESRDLELWRDDDAAESGRPGTSGSQSPDTTSQSQSQPQPQTSPRRQPDAVDAVLADDANGAPAGRQKLPESAAEPNKRRKVIFAIVLVVLFLFGLMIAVGGSGKKSTTTTGVGTGVNNPTTTYAATIAPTTDKTGTATVGNYQSEAQAVVQQAASFLRRFDRIHGGLPGSDSKLAKLLSDAVGVPVNNVHTKPGELSFTRISTNNSVLLIMTDPQTKAPAILTVHLAR